MQAQPTTPPQEIAEDASPEDNSDLQSLFAEVNNLPADDPLRAGDSQQAAALSSDGESNGVSAIAAVAPSPAPTRVAGDTTNSGLRDTGGAEPALPPPQSDIANAVPAAKPESGTLLTDAKHRVAVPSFAGASVRQVVERAGMAGLAVQLLGNGLARQQAPAAGTMVPMGTEIIVRFAR
jgi:cell division protein FtsI (penicillin-binding protein 3)